MTEHFRFASWAWLLLIPLAIWLLYRRTAKKASIGVLYSNVKGLESPPASIWEYINWLLPWMEGLSICLMLVALARPQMGRTETQIHGQGIAIELILDISGSMEALDFKIDGAEVDRLTAVKHVVKDFVGGQSIHGLKGRPADQIGLVAFGGYADSRCPLTLDHTALLYIVDELAVPSAIRDARGNILNEQALQEELSTAIGDGLALGLEQLKNSKAKSRIAVLLTDGDNNAGIVDPREAAMLAKQLGIKVYTIGIGRDGVVPMPRSDIFGGTMIVPTTLTFDEALLKEIASDTGGSYFHASDTGGLAEVYAQIDELEKSDIEESQYARYRELFPSFLLPGLCLIGIVHILRQTRFRRLL